MAQVNSSEQLLTCDEVLSRWGSTGVVLHHLQFDFILLARSQARLLKGGLRRAQRIQDLAILLFLSSKAKQRSHCQQRLKALFALFLSVLKSWPHVSVVRRTKVSEGWHL